VVGLATGASACADDRSAALRSAGGSADVVLGAVVHGGTNFTPATMNIWVTDPSTTAYAYDIEAGLPNLSEIPLPPAWDGVWNNRISSVQTCNRCDIRL
jgi:hypothetical protein